MSLTRLFYFAVVIASSAFAVINILSCFITKKVVKALVNFVWLILVGVVFVCTWIYFQGFVLSLEAYSYVGPEINYVYSGVINNILVAQICLFGTILLTVILLIYVILLIKKIIIGTKKAAIKTGEVIKETAVKTSDAIKETATKTSEAIKDTASKTTEAIKETANKANDTVKGVFGKKEDATNVEISDLQNDDPNIK